MSILKNFEIDKARFTSAQADTIEVTYLDGDKLCGYYVPAGQATNEDLLYIQSIGWGFEEISAETQRWVKEQAILSKNYHKALAAAEVSKLEKEMTAKLETLKQEELSKSNVFSAVVENNADEDVVFRAKLAAFEMTKIKSSKSKTMKSNIRKAKTLIEVFSLIEKYL